MQTNISPESKAQKLYPDPINGNTYDKNDFELRKLKAHIQRQAYLKGFKDRQKLENQNLIIK